MDAFHCSFCGKARREVRKLVSGPRVFICDACVVVCRREIGPRPPAADPIVPEGATLETIDVFKAAVAIRTAEMMGELDGATAGAKLSRIYGVRFTDLDRLDIPEDVARLVPGALARQHWVIPCARSEAEVTVAMRDPTSADAIAAVAHATQLKVRPTVAGVRALGRKLDLRYPPPPREGPDCSFCGTAKSDVSHMIARPNLFICNACVDLAEDIVEEELHAAPGAPQ